MAENPRAGTARLDPHPTTSTGSGIVSLWRLPARLIWGLAAVFMIGLTLAGAPYRYAQLMAEAQTFAPQLAGLGLSQGVYVAIWLGWAVVIMLVCCLPGLLIFWRRSDDWLALLVSLTLIAVGTVSPNFVDALRDALPDQGWLKIAADFIRSASEGLPVLVLILFPTGHAEPRFARPAVGLMLLWTLVRPFLVGTPFHPYQWSAGLLALYLALTLGGAIAAQVYRYRSISTPVQKQQTKWIVLGGTIAVVGLVILKVILAVFPALAVHDTPFTLAYGLIEYSIYSLCILPVPVAFTVSMLRYRLWDVDFIINRSLVYGGLTLLLALVFGGALLAVQGIALAVTGQELPAVGVAAAALMVGVLFQPARNTLRRFVDQRFYGIELDYKKLLADRDEIKSGDTRSNFGDYSDLKLIGRGGMGEVYTATDPVLHRTIAIKMLPALLAADESARKRFLREAQMVSKLNHPNIVGVHEFGEQDGVPFMIMEYLDGVGLNQVIKQRGPLPLPEVIATLQGIAAALDYAHAQGIVHRDIKPSNVMLSNTITRVGSGSPIHAVLMDFGIAYAATGVTSRLTASGIIGTLDYIAPEQIQGTAEVGPQADIYSLGVVAFELLTGQLPYRHANPAAMLIAHLMEPAPDPCGLRRDLPEEICEGVLKALAKKPDQRFKSAGEFAAALAG